jgi:uncharacterized protein
MIDFLNIFRKLAALLVWGALCTVPANAAEYAPLDCSKANSTAERTVCSDYGLGQSEARIATLFELTTSLVAMGQRAQIQDDQRAFLKERDACGSDVACIRSAYAVRNKLLEAVMTRIKERGPF